jgi:hypothetical protein
MRHGNFVLAPDAVRRRLGVSSWGCPKPARLRRLLQAAGAGAGAGGEDVVVVIIICCVLPAAAVVVVVCL